MLAVITAVAAVQAKPVLFGYDVVEYFSLNDGDEGVMGTEDYQYDLLTTDMSDNENPMDDTNYTFYFKDQANLDLFAADPWKYAPKWGGF